MREVNVHSRWCASVVWFCIPLMSNARAEDNRALAAESGPEQNRNRDQFHRHETRPDSGGRVQDGQPGIRSRIRQVVPCVLPRLQSECGSRARQGASRTPGTNHQAVLLGSADVAVGQFRAFVRDSGYRTDAEKGTRTRFDARDRGKGAIGWDVKTGDQDFRAEYSCAIRGSRRPTIIRSSA